MPSGQRIDENGLKALIDDEVNIALGYVGKLSAQRQKALYYYFGEAKYELLPPEVDGRSSVVSNDVCDVVEWMLPGLLKVFCGSDEAVQCEPETEADIPAAEQATSYANYVFYRQNPGFQIMHNWIKDALIEKAGIVKVWWDTREDVAREEYEGLTLAELSDILRDKTVEVVDQREYPDPDWQAPQMAPPAPGMAPPAPGAQGMAPAMPPMAPGAPQAVSAPPGGMPQPGMAPMQPPQPPMLYDVTLRRTKRSQKVCVENVPPEEFLISRRARTIQEPYFIGQRVRRSASDLIAMGYSQKQVDAIGYDDLGAEWNQERIERLSYDDEWPGFRQETGGDPSRREIWLIEGYLNVDYDGDGIAELRRVVKAGDQLLENEAIDEHPFCLITPFLMPHRVIGRSLADVTFDIQRINTVLLRQYLDATYLATNPRMYVDTTQGVNLDDLLTVRPGGIVRGKGPNGVTPMQIPDVGAVALQGLQFMQELRENRTGVTKQTQGIDPDALQRTATGVNAMLGASNQRMELIARNFAETGVRDLFRKILKLGAQYAQQPVMLRLNGKFVPVDPREWKTQFDITINVGLGTGTKDQQMQHLMLVLQAQQQAIQLGVATPENVYEALSELTKAAGFKEVSKFWTDPKTVPPQPPQPPLPLMVEQMKAQYALQADQAKAQGQAQADTARAQADQQIQLAKVQSDAALDKAKTEMQLQLDDVRHSREQDTEIRLASIRAAAQVAAARIAAGIDDGSAVLHAELMGAGEATAASQLHGRVDALTAHVGALAQAVQAAQQPKRFRIVRDATGRAQGVETVQ